MMPWNMQLRLSGNYTEKSYTSEQAFADAQDTLGINGLRADEQSRVNFSLTKRFFPGKQFIKQLQIELKYGYLRNVSNSYWYDYRNSWLNLGFQVRL